MTRFFHFFFSILFFACSSLFSGNVVYVANSGGNTISVVSTSTNTVIGSITVGNGPEGVAFTPDGKFAYVSNSADNTVSIIDTNTQTVVGAPITVGTTPRDLIVTPDGQYVYVANEGSDDVSVISTATNTVTTTIGGVGDGPFGVTVAPDGSTVYVTTVNAGNVVFIDTATNSITTTVVSGSDPSGIGITPDGQTLYVGNTGDGEATFINTSTLATGLVFLNNGPNGVAASLDGSRVYITDLIGPPDRLAVVDTSTNTAIAFINGLTGPWRVAISSNGEIAYVTNSGNGTLAIIDLVNQTILSTIAVGSGPHGVAVLPETFSVSGVAKKDSFMTETNIFNKLSWDAPSNITADRYLIYRDSKLVGTVPGNNLSFDDNNLKRKTTYSYLIVAEGPGGSGAVGKVTVRTKS